MNKTWIVVIVVAIVAGAWWLNRDSSDLSLSPGVSSSPTPVGATKTPAVSNSKVTPKSSPTVTSNLSYTQLVALYGSNRIQFNQDCKGQPGSMVLKNGTSILLDNRSNKTQVITLNGASYTLVPYGYRVVTVSSSSLPKDIGVSCNDSINAGMINLQANISGQ